jgi:hypothetical protein
VSRESSAIWRAVSGSSLILLLLSFGSGRGFVTVVALRQVSHRLRDRGWIYRRAFGKSDQRRLMRDDELQHAGEEPWLSRCLTDRLWVDAGDRKETRKQGWVGGDETERGDCYFLCSLVRLSWICHDLLEISVLQFGWLIGTLCCPQAKPVSARVLRAPKNTESLRESITVS